MASRACGTAGPPGRTSLDGSVPLVALRFASRSARTPRRVLTRRMLTYPPLALPSSPCGGSGVSHVRHPAPTACRQPGMADARAAPSSSFPSGVRCHSNPPTWSAMPVNTSIGTCWYRLAMLACDQPITSMTARVGTFRTRSIVAAVCRASCSRAALTSAAPRTARHSPKSARGSIGLPVGWANIQPPRSPEGRQHGEQVKEGAAS